MQSMCPVCNGLTQLQAICSICYQPMIDLGRETDFWDDYSPYREIQHLLMGMNTTENKTVCLHLAHCPFCDHEQTVAVEEKP